VLSHDEILPPIQRAVSVLEEAIQRYPADAECRDELARRTNDLANAFVHRSRFDEAEQAYNRVSALILQVDPALRSVARYALTRAYHSKDFGVFLIDRNPPLAESMLREAVQIFANIAANDRTEPFHIQFLNHSRISLARLLDETGRAEEAATFRDEAHQDAQKLVDNHPAVPGFHNTMIFLLQRDLNDKMKLHDYDAAEAACRAIIGQCEQLAALTPDQVTEQALAASRKKLQQIMALKVDASAFSGR
jgi:tetratricopeptide (TPR) repeat protein